jgi:multiple sugar transport system substrate-binding protein
MKKISTYFSLFMLLVILVTTGFGCKNPGKAVQERLKPVTLEYWRVWEDAEVFAPIIADYQAAHPNIKINYRKFRYEEYEKQLLEAFAEDRGPDIFSIPESWLREYETKLTPMPPEVTMVYQELKGAIKKEIVQTLRTSPTPSFREIKQIFPDTVYTDVVIGDQLYGLPLSLDSLVMFYNKDLLNGAGITVPPKTWDEFSAASVKMTRYDAKGIPIQSGSALGTGSNINPSADIASVLMMQNGAIMTGANGTPTFMAERNNSNPGLQALRFYTEFASPVKNVYSWNTEMANAFDVFTSGRVAMIFGYNYNLPTLRARAPKINLGIAPIPQISTERPINYASYWIETVSKKSVNTDEAWDFILFMTTRENQAKKFADATKRPAALRSLINSQIEDEDLNAAATQTLTATNWYQGRDSIAAETAFRTMLDDLSNALTEKDIEIVVNTALQKIIQTL